VVGLQNLDKESEEFRPFKELIERLSRTYQFHTRAAGGFNSVNGAVALTTLFVTYYNFLRPHISLNYSVPIPLEPLKGIAWVQVTNATLNFGIIYQKKGVAYDPLLSVKYQ